MIKIETRPFVLTDKQKYNPAWQLRQKFATEDLICAKESLMRKLEHDIPLTFNCDIILSVSINKTNMKTKIDYSATKNKKAVRLIKLYLSEDMEIFAEEWMKLA